MSVKTPPKLKVVPKLMKLEMGLKLAESWVNNMSGSAMDESTEVEYDGRPSRLGLGAKVMLKSKEGASTDPVERKLRAKLDGKKRIVAAENKEESNPSESQVNDSSDDEESRTNAFIKKRAQSSPLPSLRNKRHK